MGRLTDALGAPRREAVTLSNGTTVTLAELSLAVTWPFMNGVAVDPELLIRASLVDAHGDPLIAPDDAIPMIQALELIPHILKFNGMELAKKETAPEVAELERDFPQAAPAA